MNRVPLLIAISIALWFITSKQSNAQTAEQVTLHYQIDRAAVPHTIYQDITLLITVGQANNIQVTDGANNVVIHEYDMETGVAQVTTDQPDIYLSAELITPSENLGTYEIAPLRGNKAWAWSHGFDDNTRLKAAIDVFESYDWQGTLYLIMDIVEDDREQDWIIDAPDIYRYLEQGWAVGNHSWSHECGLDGDTEAAETSVLNAHARLEEILAQSPQPDYPVISFAAPCFDGTYHDVILKMRDEQQNTLLFNESGAGYALWVDPDADSNTLSQEESLRLSTFNYDRPIGRDPRISNADAIIAQLDFMAAQAKTGKHLWYNSLAHGNAEEILQTILEHAYNSYGPAGTDELWVAPAAEIYSYLMVRDFSTVTLINSQTVEVQTDSIDQTTPTAVPEPSQTPTTVATATTVEKDSEPVIDEPTAAVAENTPTAVPNEPLETPDQASETNNSDQTQLLLLMFVMALAAALMLRRHRRNK